MKKDQYGWFRFYIVRTFLAIAAGIAYTVECLCGIGRFFTGQWYCEECGRYHNRRTVRYCIVEFQYCYRAMRRMARKEARRTGMPLADIPLSVDKVYLGGEDITTSIRALSRKGGFWE